MSEEELRAELTSRVKALQRRTAGLPSLVASEADFHTLGEQRLFRDLQAMQVGSWRGCAGPKRWQRTAAALSRLSVPCRWGSACLSGRRICVLCSMVWAGGCAGRCSRIQELGLFTQRVLLLAMNSGRGSRPGAAAYGSAVRPARLSQGAAVAHLKMVAPLRSSRSWVTERARDVLELQRGAVCKHRRMPTCRHDPRARGR